MKLQITIRKKSSKLWEWQYTNADGEYYAGLCATKRDALNDGSVMAGLRWERATDDMWSADIGNDLQLCCTRGLEEDNRVTWELGIIDTEACDHGKTNVFDSEAEAKCCAPAFLHKWRQEQTEEEDQQSCCMTPCEWPAITTRGTRHLCAQCAEAFDAGVLFAQSKR